MFKQPSHKNLDFEQEFSHSRTAESTIKRCLNKVIEIRVQFAKISDNKIVSENLEELQHELLDLIYSGKLSDKDVENTKNNEPENEPENDWIEPFPMSIDDEEKPTQMNVELQAEKEREEKEPEADVEFKNETEFRRINRGKPVSTIINLKFNRVLRMVKDGMDIKDALSALGISIGTFYYAISKEKKEKLAKAKKRAKAAKVKRAEEQTDPFNSATK